MTNYALPNLTAAAREWLNVTAAGCRLRQYALRAYRANTATVAVHLAGDGRP